MNPTTPAPPATSDGVRIDPMDVFNESLVQDAHPPDWVNPVPKPRYNLVVLGAGTAGLVTAAIAAGLGARVALVEKHLMGGDCLNYGCVPSKAVIRSSKVVADLHQATKFGVNVSERYQPDFGAVMERMRRLRSHISAHDSVCRFTELGVDVFLGNAQFAGPDTVDAAGQKIRFKKAVIATGARPAHPPIEGLAEAGFLTNETVFSLTELPRHFLVIGGGPIGCELAQAFGRLGSRVTLIEAGPQFLPREDPDAARILADAFAREGIRVLLNTKVQRVTREGDKSVIHLEREGQTESITANQILVGVGRSPNVDDLNLEAVGVAYDTRTGVHVDDHLQTTNPNIFAAGDVCSPYKFTHTADFAARIVAQNALFPFLPKKRFSDLVIPWCTYTDPEIAHVGAYERELQEKGIDCETIVIPFEDIDRAILDGESEGILKVHFSPKNGRILGSTLVSRHAGESISEITLAMVGRMKLGSISSVIHPYPTQAEAIRKAADQYNRRRLTPQRKKLLAWLLKKMR